MNDTQAVRVLRPIKFDQSGVRKPGAIVHVPQGSLAWLLAEGCVERVTKLTAVPGADADAADQAADPALHNADADPADNAAEHAKPTKPAKRRTRKDPR